MKIIDIYNKLKNPIENLEILKKIIKLYEKSRDKSEYLDELTKKEVSEEIDLKERDYFYSIAFNEWKKNIIDMPFKRFSNLLKNDKYKKDFSKMKEFLEGIPNVKNKAEVDKIIYSEYKGKDSEITETLKTYYWIKNEEQNWEYVSSQLISIKKYRDPNLEHNLYINISNSHIYGMASKFLEKCIEYELPYCFRIDKTGKRIDSIIITADSDVIVNYIKILNEIKRENPEFIVGQKNQSILVGRLASWLGYGEFPENPLGENPFYAIRVEHLYTSINTVINSWIRNNINNKKFRTEIINSIIDKIKEDSNYLPKLELFEESELIEVFEEVLEELLEEYCKDCQKGIDINNLDNGDAISITKEDLSFCIKNISMKFLEEDEHFIENIKQEVIKTCKKYNIDSNKYCFNISETR